MAEQFVKGIILKSRLDFLEEYFGPEALAKVLPHLRGKTRELFSDPKKIRATSWYEFDINLEIDEAIREVLADGDKEIFWKMGAFTNDFQTTETSRHAYKDPWKFLSLHCGVMPRFWKPGNADLLKVKEGEAIVKFNVVRSTRDYCLTNLGFFKMGLELSGATEVVAEEVRCVDDPGPYCEYRLRFKWVPDKDGK